MASVGDMGQHRGNDDSFVIGGIYGIYVEDGFAAVFLPLLCFVFILRVLLGGRGLGVASGQSWRVSSWNLGWRLGCRVEKHLSPPIGVFPFVLG